MYNRFEALKSNPKSGIFCFWNYFYIQGDYETQLKEMSEIYSKNLEKFEKDPVNNTFKEVIIVKMKEKDDEKVEKILDTFASDKKDVYCPFIIFFFDSKGDEFPQVKFDEDNLYLLFIFLNQYKNLFITFHP